MLDILIALVALALLWARALTAALPVAWVPTRASPCLSPRAGRARGQWAPAAIPVQRVGTGRFVGAGGRGWARLAGWCGWADCDGDPGGDRGRGWVSNRGL